jgi:DNA-binding MarR family transcriptional regulator/GNAT superfamily N-acetyltransferase
MTETGRDLAPCIDAVRRFSRFYTRQIGLLHEGFLGTPLSLTEGRVLYELAHREHATASELCADLGVDPGYLSRVIRGFEQQGLVHRRPSERDGRQMIVRLTEAGERAFATINARSQQEIARMVERLSPAERARLIEALRTVQDLLGARPEARVPYILRPPQPGDMGWVVHRHGVLYAQEYGWDQRFEALVAGIVAQFVERCNPKRERCWLAEIDGEVVGSVFLVERSAAVAQLRLLLVEPRARGLGIGSRLVEECVRFARQAGYARVMLWTNSVLAAARRIYAKAGFTLTHEERHHSFGHDLVGETWELTL